MEADMANIKIARPEQTEASVQFLLGRKNTQELIIDVFHVSDFMGVWYQVSKSPKGYRPYDGIASPGLTKSLKALDVKPGDQVLVVRHPSVLHEHRIRLVAPLTDENRHLIGQRFKAPKSMSLGFS
jgi:hypothetical protein